MALSTREKIARIVFESDTWSGKLFDLVLIVAILISVALVSLESVASIRVEYGEALYVADWVFTIVFTCEYFLRIYAVRRRRQYLFSFFGIIDLLAILPTYLSLLIPGAQSLLIIRVFRLLRIFRIFKLAHYLGEGQMLMAALRSSRPKIVVFLLAIFSTVLTMGALMYVVEGPDSGFTSIPIGIYWAIVTMTTVGFGDITPQTPLGQLLASALMIMGYGVIAVPTGIVTSEITRAQRYLKLDGRACPECQELAHADDAKFCRLCGSGLNIPTEAR